ncbi:MAG: hypothetical protein CFE44_27735, partial [Burkholderiales bacterium PBB4]
GFSVQALDGLLQLAPAPVTKLVADFAGSAENTSSPSGQRQSATVVVTPPWGDVRILSHLKLKHWANSLP